MRWILRIVHRKLLSMLSLEDALSMTSADFQIACSKAFGNGFEIQGMLLQVNEPNEIEVSVSYRDLTKNGRNLVEID